MPLTPHKVVIAGAGVAGLEALAALHRLAGDRVQIKVVEPAGTFVLQALSVANPFAQPGAHPYSVARICADHRAEFVQDTVTEVQWSSVRTASGSAIDFDSLLVAVGARREPAYREALTFRDVRDVERMHGLIQDMEAGYLKNLAFVVPPGVTWTLPLYELALMAAERADSLCLDWLRIAFVTPEARPLEKFGEPAIEAVSEALETSRITFHGSVEVAGMREGSVVSEEGLKIAAADRMVALPQLLGPRVPGLPTDAEGFIPSDVHARVQGMRGVYAAGDGTTQTIKQGGVGAQQAVSAARHIAMRAGANVEPVRFDPILRAKLFTGGAPWYLRRSASGGPASASTDPLWSPAAKVVAPYLTDYLQRLERDPHRPSPGKQLSEV